MSKIWLVTGGGRGLGHAIVAAALAAGDRVVATARDLTGLSELQALNPTTLRTFALDVTDDRRARAAIAFAAEAFGRLDVLVNNAGFGSVAPFEQTAEADFRAQIEANFYGVVSLTRAALPGMRRQRAGHIINISSVGGRVSTPGLSAYQAAKWAVSGFTEVLAKEVAPFGVEAISVEPGGMRTAWMASASNHDPVILEEYEPSVGEVLRRHAAYAGNEGGDPAKVAAVIVDLSRGRNLPAHLILGSDALHAIGEADARRSADAEAWQSVSRSTDFV